MTRKPEKHHEIRRGMADDLHTKLFGPLDPADEGKIKVDPLQYYSTGVLFPQELLQKQLDAHGDDDAALDDAERVDSSMADATKASKASKVSYKTGEVDSASDVAEPLNLVNEFSPAAMGLTFRVVAGTELSFDITAATYRSEKDPERPQGTLWCREPIAVTKNMVIDGAGALGNISIPS